MMSYLFFCQQEIYGKSKNVRIYIWIAFVTHSIVLLIYLPLCHCALVVSTLFISCSDSWEHSIKTVTCSVAPLGTCYWRKTGYCWRVWVWMTWYDTWLDPYSSAVISVCSINVGVGLLPTESTLSPESWNLLSGNECMYVGYRFLVFHVIRYAKLCLICSWKAVV